MISINIFSVISISMLFLSLIATWLSYKIYKYNRLSRGWLSITLAFTLVAFSRILSFSEDLGIFLELNKSVLKIWDVILLILINILFITGLLSMLRSFESFDIVEKKVQEKLKIFRKR